LRNKITAILFCFYQVFISLFIRLLSAYLYHDLSKSNQRAMTKSGTETVNAYIQKLDEPTASIVETLRQIILSTHPEIGEEIKWNAPSFYYTGEMKPFNPKEYKRHIIVMNLHNRILMVLSSGAKVNDTSGLLEGDYTDGRRLIKITSMDDVKKKETALRKVIQNWLSLVEK
jgi:hypothetical protein